MYIDESKRDGYLMVGVLIDSEHVQETRRMMTSLLLPGQERIHFKSESDSRRKAILKQISLLSIRAAVANAPQWNSEATARSACLAELLKVAIHLDVSHLCIERAKSFERLDRNLVRTAIKELPRWRGLSTRLEPARAEPLLWIADAIAWAYPQRVRWREIVAPMIRA